MNLDPFLSHEWLVRTSESIPYLVKFHACPDTSLLSVVVTDTKSVWIEALKPHQLSPRWERCNPDAQPAIFVEDESWRAAIISLISNVHTLEGFQEISLEVQESTYSDLSFTISHDTFLWTWQLDILPHNIAADFLSKHLILPLISLNHLAFTTTSVPKELTEESLKTNIEQVARTARRAIDTHIKNAIAKPHITTGLALLTSMVHKHSETPRIRMTLLDAADLVLPKAVVLQTDKEEPSTPQELLPNSESPVSEPSPVDVVALAAPIEVDSDVTDDESAGELEFPLPSQTQTAHPKPVGSSAFHPVSQPQSDSDDPGPARKKLVKRSRVDSMSDENLEEEKKRVADSRVRAGTGATRGTRQPQARKGGKKKF